MLVATGPHDCEGNVCVCTGAGARGGRGPSRLGHAWLSVLRLHLAGKLGAASGAASSRLLLPPPRSPQASFTYGPLVRIFITPPPASSRTRAGSKHAPARADPGAQAAAGHRAQTGPGVQAALSKKDSYTLSLVPTSLTTFPIVFQEAHLPHQAPPPLLSLPTPTQTLHISLALSLKHTHTLFLPPQTDNPYGESLVPFE